MFTAIIEETESSIHVKTSPTQHADPNPHQSLNHTHDLIGEVNSLIGIIKCMIYVEYTFYVCIMHIYEHM